MSGPTAQRRGEKRPKKDADDGVEESEGGGVSGFLEKERPVRSLEVWAGRHCHCHSR